MPSTSEIMNSVLDSTNNRLNVASAESVTRTSPMWVCDFTFSGATQVDPFGGTAIASGTSSSTAITSSPEHPGVLRLASSTSTNSGYVYSTATTAILLGGGEVFNCIFYPNLLTNSTMRIGFHDTLTSTDATDGVYIEIDGSGNVTGKTANNTTRSTTGTTGTVVINTWYRIRIALNDAATLATYQLYSDAGTLLWSDTLTTNIPTGAGRETGAAILATNSGTVANNLVHVDYMSVQFPSLTRGGV